MPSPRHRLSDTGLRTLLRRTVRCVIFLASALVGTQLAGAADFAEYRLKAAFLFNFAVFTDWPVSVGNTLQLCVYGPDPFAAELDKLESKKVGQRSVVIRRSNSADGLANCQIVFITRPMIGNLSRVRDTLAGKPALLISDSPGATRLGVTINMSTDNEKISFEANLGAARSSGLNLDSRLLRLATEVIQ